MPLEVSGIATKSWLIKRRNGQSVDVQDLYGGHESSLSVLIAKRSFSGELDSECF